MVEFPVLLALSSLRQDFREISIFDFEPKIMKGGTPVAGKSDLEENGSNIAIVLQRILEDKEKRRAFTNLFTALLPFVQDIRVDRFADKSLLLALQEMYAHDNFIPASLLSDGTVVVAAIVAALYFEEKKILLFEEPAAFLHPSLMSGLVEMMKEVSSNKQIIMTTHNPELLRYVDINNVLLVQRGKDGFSQITRPGEREDVKIFLENEMGINELFAQNLLEV
jgi:predicted ATPase